MCLFQALGHDVLMSMREDEWGVLCSKDKTSMSVVLRDRLMTDAALGGSKPIKTEHSYSLLACSPPPSPESPSDANPHTPHSLDSPNSAISAGSTTVISCSSDTSVQTHKTMELRSRIHGKDNNVSFHSRISNILLRQCYFSEKIAFLWNNVLKINFLEKILKIRNSFFDDKRFSITFLKGRLGTFFKIMYNKCFRKVRWMFFDHPVQLLKWRNYLQSVFRLWGFQNKKLMVI